MHLNKFQRETHASIIMRPFVPIFQAPGKRLIFLYYIIRKCRITAKLKYGGEKGTDDDDIIAVTECAIFNEHRASVINRVF